MTVKKLVAVLIACVVFSLGALGCGGIGAGVSSPADSAGNAEAADENNGDVQDATVGAEESADSDNQADADDPADMNVLGDDDDEDVQGESDDEQTGQDGQNDDGTDDGQTGDDAADGEFGGDDPGDVPGDDGQPDGDDPGDDDMGQGDDDDTSGGVGTGCPSSGLQGTPCTLVLNGTGTNPGEGVGPVEVIASFDGPEGWRIIYSPDLPIFGPVCTELTPAGDAHINFPSCPEQISLGTIAFVDADDQMSIAGDLVFERGVDYACGQSVTITFATPCTVTLETQ